MIIVSRSIRPRDFYYLLIRSIYMYIDFDVSDVHDPVDETKSIVILLLILSTEVCISCIFAYPLLFKYGWAKTIALLFIDTSVLKETDKNNLIYK